MNTEQKKEQQNKQGSPETAVWYFVGATFAVTVGPMMFGGDGEIAWVTPSFILLGVVLIICGGIQLGKEIRLKKEAKQAAANGPAPEHPPSGS